MDKGEWSESEALVLSKAIGALVLNSIELDESESGPIQLISRLRIFKQDVPFRMGFGGSKIEDPYKVAGFDLGDYGHLDNWFLEFEANLYPTLRTKVHVQMGCVRPLACKYGHYYEYGNVYVTRENSREGRDTWAYCWRNNQPLKKEDFASKSIE